MAEEVKKEAKPAKKGLGPIESFFIGCGSGALLTLILIESSRSNIYNDKIKTGTYVKLAEDAKIYGTLTDSLNGQNGKEYIYDADELRLVLSTFYEVNGEFKRVNITDPNYKANENQLINSGATVVCYLTTTDLEKHTPEGYYLVSDTIKYESENLSKQKILKNKNSK